MSEEKVENVVDDVEKGKAKSYPNDKTGSYDKTNTAPRAYFNDRKKDDVLKVFSETKEDDVMKNLIHTKEERVVSPKTLLDAGCYFGHKDSYWNPKMRKYIYGVKNHLHIIDMNITAKQIQIAYNALKDIAARGGKVLFVGTKKTASVAVKEEAIRSGSFYVSRRWLGGTLTNFATINKRIQLLKQLESEESQGSFDLLPKKEAANKLKLKEKLSLNLDGLKEIRYIPNAIVIIDPKTEHNAIAEARQLHIPVFCLADTNSNPDLIDYIIPCNDDSETATRLVVGLLADAVVEGKGGVPVYAYKDTDQNPTTMNAILSSSDPVEQTRIIKMKLKTDNYLNRKKKKMSPSKALYFKKNFEMQQQQQNNTTENKEQVEEKPVEKKENSTSAKEGE